MSTTDPTTETAAALTLEGSVAVITIRNPPVNGLSAEVRLALGTALASASADPGVRSVVITGADRGFSGGADVRQFNTPLATRRPRLRDLVETIQAMQIPVVAAIHGYAFGGALELALGCHHRVVLEGTLLGLTEVSLGIVPGAGGSQYLPRLIGVPAALELIQHARRVDAAEALEIGLVDAVFTDDLVAQAVVFAETRSAADTSGFVAQATPVETAFDFAKARDAVSRRDRTATAQRAAIDCVELATTQTLLDGCDQERKIFDELVASAESKAVSHLSFAERSAASIRSLHGKPRVVRTVGVVGAGTMGTGIAMAFADHGYDVLLNDASSQGIDAGMARILSTYEISAGRGRLTAAEVIRRMDRIQAAPDLRSFADVDLVIEAVFEQMDVKQEVFVRLEDICRDDCILASNTSRLDVNELARSTAHPERVIGLHFFSPANVMQLLEIVRPDAVADDVLATCISVAERIGKKPVTVGVCEGFVGNRMLTPYWTETWFLAEEGASPRQVDDVMRSFGMAMGPFAVADLAGLDINWAARKRLAPTRRPALRYSRLADAVCEEGRFGMKTGAGWYRYEADSRTPLEDPAVDQIIERTAIEAGIERHPIADGDIVERCLLALVNEGAKILDDGIVSRSGDIDVVYVNGYGFPARVGGPMFWAEQQGLASVLARIQALHADQGERWSPAARLVEQVRAGAATFDKVGHS